MSLQHDTARRQRRREAAARSRERREAARRTLHQARIHSWYTLRRGRVRPTCTAEVIARVHDDASGEHRTARCPWCDHALDVPEEATA